MTRRPADLGTDFLADVLPTAGFKVGEPAAFTAEGLTMYLTESQVTGLLTTLARLAAPGSRLAANFGVGFEGDESPRGRAVTALGRVMTALSHEPMRFRLAPEHTTAFLADAGWTTQEMLTGPDLAIRYLAGTVLATELLNPRSFVVSATRS